MLFALAKTLDASRCWRVPESTNGQIVFPIKPLSQFSAVCTLSCASAKIPNKLIRENPNNKIMLANFMRIIILFYASRASFYNYFANLDSTLLSSTAFVATMIEEADMSKAAISGRSDHPKLV